MIDKVLILLLTVCIFLTIYRFGQPILPTFLTDDSSVAALGSIPEPEPAPTGSASQGQIASPTVAAFFRAEDTFRPAPQATTGGRVLIPTATPVAERESSSSAAVLPATSQLTETQPLSPSLIYDPAIYREVVIYDEELDQNWSFAESRGMQYSFVDTSGWIQTVAVDGSFAHGPTAIAVTPEQDYGMLVFSLRADSTVSYKAADVLGISFWLNSGDTLVETDDLAATVVGNDTQPFWTEKESAAVADGDTVFSETRLYYLDINRAIPSNTWVNIVVWMDKLIYDPTYTYVAGFYIKNDLEIRNTFYVDRVSLLMRNTP